MLHSSNHIKLHGPGNTSATIPTHTILGYKYREASTRDAAQKTTVQTDERLKGYADRHKTMLSKTVIGSSAKVKLYKDILNNPNQKDLDTVRRQITDRAEKINRIYTPVSATASRVDGVIKDNAAMPITTAGTNQNLVLSTEVLIDEPKKETKFGLIAAAAAIVIFIMMKG